MSEVLRGMLDINLRVEQVIRACMADTPVGRADRNGGYPHSMGVPLENVRARIVWLRNQLGEGCIDRGTTIRIQEINMGRRKTDMDKAARRARNKAAKTAEKKQGPEPTARQLLEHQLNQRRRINKLLAERAESVQIATPGVIQAEMVNGDGEPAIGTQTAEPLSAQAFPVVDQSPPEQTNGLE